MRSRPVHVLFVCAENACQSQMAEGWLRRLAGERFIARSAGPTPRYLHPLATRVMQEAEIDIARQRCKGFDAVRNESFDVVVTLCDVTAEMGLPASCGGATREHRDVDDPTWLESEDGDDLEEFRRVRDGVRATVEELIGRWNAASTGGKPAVL